MKTFEQFITAVKEEKQGFSFADPWRYNEEALTAVLPIIRETVVNRNYLTLVEAMDTIKMRDSGSVGEVKLENIGDTNVFIRAGTIFEGDTQNRAASYSQMIFPGQKVPVEVVCVHASHGVNSGSVMAYGGIVPQSLNLSDQHKAWESVSAYALRAETTHQPVDTRPVLASEFHEMIAPPSVKRGEMDNLVGSMKLYNKTVEGILKSVPLLVNQVGMAMIGHDGFHGLEAFNLDLPWSALKEDVVKREGETLSKIDKHLTFNYKPEKAIQEVQNALDHKFKAKVLYENRRTKTLSLTNGSIVGEATVFEGKVIHLDLARKVA